MTTEKHDDPFLDLREKVRGALPPVENSDLRHDLWPVMLQRMANMPAPPVAWSFRVPWFDWALLALTGAALIFFPSLLPALLYHL
jgi:hypothetical protein